MLSGLELYSNVKYSFELVGVTSSLLSFCVAPDLPPDQFSIFSPQNPLPGPRRALTLWECPRRCPRVSAWNHDPSFPTKATAAILNPTSSHPRGSSEGTGRRSPVTSWRNWRRPSPGRTTRTSSLGTLWGYQYC